MKNTIYFFIFFFTNIQVFAQNKLADSLQQYANYTEALAMYQSDLTTFENEKDWKNYIKTSNKIAQNLSYQGKFDESLALLENLNTTQKEILETEELLQADICNALAFNYLNKGQNQKALDFFEQALDAYQKEKALNRSETALCYNNLGIAYWNKGSTSQALDYLEQSLQIRKELFGEMHPEVAASYNDLGLIYSIRSPKIAIDYYEKSLEIYKNIYGNYHPKIAIIYNNLGAYYLQNKSYNEAENYFESSLEIWQNIYPEGHPNIAFIYSNLGQIASQRNVYSQALNYQQESLSIYQKYYGTRHPEIANTYNSIGIIYLEQNLFEEALNNFQKALISNTSDFTNENWEINPPLKNYYNAEIFLVSLMLKAETLENQYFQKTLSFNNLSFALSSLEDCDFLLSQIRQLRNNPEDKIALGELASEVYENAIRICLALGEVSLKSNFYKEKAFYFAEKNKSIVLLESITDSQAKNFAGIPQDMIEKEQELTEEIAFLERELSAKPAEDLEAQIREQLFEYQGLYKDFINQLEVDYPEYFELKYSIKTATVDEIQSKLDKKTIIMSYFIGPKTQRLYIFQISKKKFKVFDLPLPQRLSGNVIALRNSIRYNSPNTFQKTALFLYENLFPKNIASKYKKIIVIPEGQLNILPFEVLLTQKSKEETAQNQWNYLLKKQAISYAYSATILLQSLENEQVPINAENIALFAPVDFSNEKLNYLNRLPATKEEVFEIADLLPEKPQILIEENALESQIKSDFLKQITYLHFATHGIIDENSPERSQIVLRQDETAGEDGSLFFGEIYNLRLNANLVTLSACETGLGKLTQGEGLIGLSRALLYAGADNLLVSLWAVADKSTSELMVYFYENLLKENDKSIALQKAKLDWLAAQDSESERLNLYFWSPFILIGQ